MASKLYLRLKKYFYELNLFQNPEVKNNRHQITNQLISTRILIVSFVIILFIFFLYLLSARITMTITTEAPSELSFKKLNKQFSDTLQCPCSNWSIPYQTFISLRAAFHPICSFNFEPIINASFKYTESLSNNHDFRFTAALQFRLLTLLCSSVDEIITARLIDFNKTLFPNMYLLKEANFQNQVHELIQIYIQIVTSDFINSLKMIRINTFGSQLISGVRSNYKIMGRNTLNVLDKQSWIFSTYAQIYDGPCDCSTSFLCSSSALIYDNNKTFNVNGFRIGCFIVESLLSSSLECFYNSSCLQQFLQHIQLNSIVMLQPSNKFQTTDSIETLLNSLMVEQWQNSLDYKAYFVACQAKTCSYTVTTNRSLLVIATTMLGLIGGIVTILMFIIPILVAFARKKRQVKTTSNQRTIRQFRKYLSWQKLVKQVRLVNLFRSPDSYTENDIRNEFLSTRIYVISVIIIFSLLVEYHILLISTVTVSIHFPSSDIIVKMNKSSLKCPCSMPAVHYKTFTSIQPIFHPICSSDFIDDRSFNTVNTTITENARKLQLRFQILSLYCQLTRQILKSKLRQLDNNYFLSNTLLSKKQFEAQINVSIYETIEMARLTFARSLQILVNTTQINYLLSADETFGSFGASILFSSSIPIRFYAMIEPYYIGRACEFDDQLGNITLYQFYTNCDPIQELLSSSFISLYNISLVQSLNYIGNTSYRALDLPIIYSKNATISFILSTLMLDTYLTNLSYEAYFKKCYPKTCTYTKMSQESVIDIVVTAVDLVGGLTGLLHVVIWYLIRFIRRPKKRNNQNSQQRKCLHLIISIRDQLRSLNIFCYSNNSERNQIISTRVFILLFISIVITLVFYTTLMLTTRSITIDRPTYERFASLDRQYSSTLICSCSNITTPYRTFVSFSPKFHQICSSPFTNPKFVDLLNNKFPGVYSSDELERFGGYIFSTIRVLCNLSQTTVEEQANGFLTTRFVSGQVINEQQLYAEIGKIIQAMIQASEQQATVLIKLIRDTTYSNQVGIALDGNRYY